MHTSDSEPCMVMHFEGENTNIHGNMEAEAGEMKATDKNENNTFDVYIYFLIGIIIILAILATPFFCVSRGHVKLPQSIWSTPTLVLTNTKYLSFVDKKITLERRSRDVKRVRLL